ncbi:MAG: DUF4199 domain-containing protein [Microscillaceae bacterium]|jgi:hypothetical protein|nr:DUF4199 domain-containing protein [Microscillaceae bacterium]
MNISWLKTATLAGSLGGLLFGLFFMLTILVFEQPFAPFPKSLDFFIYIATIISPLAYYRFRQNQGKLHFWEGIGIGVVAGAIVLIISALWVYVYLSIDPQPIHQYIQYYSELVQTNQKNFIEKYGKAGYDQTLQNLQSTSATRLAGEELKKAPICLLMSLIASALFRK